MRRLRCLPSDAAIREGAWVSLRGTCAWWLRKPSVRYFINAPCVTPDGLLDLMGVGVDCRDIGVRPAVWVQAGAIGGE